MNSHQNWYLVCSSSENIVKYDVSFIQLKMPSYVFMRLTVRRMALLQKAVVVAVQLVIKISPAAPKMAVV